MTKRVSLTIGTILLIIAFCFVAVAVNHPEAAFPWSNRVTFMLYGAYIWLLFKFLIAHTISQTTKRLIVKNNHLLAYGNRIFGYGNNRGKG